MKDNISLEDVRLHYLEGQGRDATEKFIILPEETIDIHWYAL